MIQYKPILKKLVSFVKKKYNLQFCLDKKEKGKKLQQKNGISTSKKKKKKIQLKRTETLHTRTPSDRAGLLKFSVKER